MKTVKEVIDQLDGAGFIDAAKVLAGFANAMLELGYSQRSNDVSVQQFLDPKFRK